jgi:CheY-like chemotaxis protein
MGLLYNRRRPPVEPDLDRSARRMTARPDALRRPGEGQARPRAVGSARMPPVDVLARCARCGLGFAGEPEDCTRITEVVVLHTRYCLGDDRSAEVWAPYAAVYAALTRHVVVAGADGDSPTALACLLRRAGHRVDEAEGVAAAVALALDARPDAVLVDVAVPGWDGLAVARQIVAARGRTAPLLVAMTCGTSREARRARAAGFDTSVRKPPAPEELERVVAAAPRMMLLRARGA